MFALTSLTLSGSNPNLSWRCLKRLHMKTSAPAMRDKATSNPASDSRSIAIDLFPRFDTSNWKSKPFLSSETFAGRPMSRIGSPFKGSILITSAPRSASMAPALGEAIQLSISITNKSSKGKIIYCTFSSGRLKSDSIKMSSSRIMYFLYRAYFQY